MWFLRRRRRPQLDLAALDRLSDTIARAVALIEQRLAPSPSPDAPRRHVELVIRREPPWPEPGLGRRPPAEPPPLEPEAEREPAPPRQERRQQRPQLEQPHGFVLFVPTPAGYRLATPDGADPEPGERLRVDEEWYRVVRLGPSPLPGDARRCAFLEAYLATLD